MPTHPRSRIRKCGHRGKLTKKSYLVILLSVSSSVPSSRTYRWQHLQILSFLLLRFAEENAINQRSGLPSFVLLITTYVGYLHYSYLHGLLGFIRSTNGFTLTHSDARVYCSSIPTTMSVLMSHPFFVWRRRHTATSSVSSDMRLNCRDYPTENYRIQQPHD